MMARRVSEFEDEISEIAIRIARLIPRQYVTREGQYIRPEDCPTLIGQWWNELFGAIATAAGAAEVLAELLRKKAGIEEEDSTETGPFESPKSSRSRRQRTGDARAEATAGRA